MRTITAIPALYSGGWSAFGNNQIYLLSAGNLHAANTQNAHHSHLAPAVHKKIPDQHDGKEADCEIGGRSPNAV